MPDRPQTTLRTMEQTLVDMLRWYAYASGIEPDTERGSILRTLFEAWGYEVEQQSFRFDTELKRGIPEAVFSAFGFARRPAQAATTSITFSRSAPSATPQLIPQGTLVTTASNTVFQTTEDTNIPPGGTSASAQAQAVVPGAAGNVAANTLTTLTTLVPGVEAATNPQAAYGGEDPETLLAQRTRFAAHLATLAKGTLPAMTAAALTVRLSTGERASKALTADNYLDNSIALGEARVYVYTPTGATQDLRDAILAHLEATQRPVGVRVTVHNVTPIPHDISITLTSPDPSTEPLATAAARAFVDALEIGQGIDVNRLTSRVITDSGAFTAVVSVENTSTSTTYEADDLAPVGDYEQATVGSITVTFA